MNHLYRTLQEIATILDELELRYALVGGIAVSMRSQERLTRDIDLAVAVTSDAQAEEVIHALLQHGYGVMTIVEQDAAGRLATARMQRTRTANEPMVDLLFASSGIEPETVAEAESLPLVPGIVTPVARLEHLVALKVLAEADDRPQDLMDLKALLQAATPEELKRVPALLRLIAERGYARTKDLEADFHLLVKRFRGDRQT